jgi:hypothetical protein
LAYRISENALTRYVAAEEIVLIATGAIDAFKAAGQQNSYTCRDQSGKGVSIDRKPVNQIIHRQSPGTTYPRNFGVEWTL